MTTYADVQALVLGDLHRDDLTTEVQTAMANARVELRMDRFFFNETEATFTVTATADYAIDTVLPDLLVIDSLRVWRSGSPCTLDRTTWLDLQNYSPSLSLGTPHSWAVHHRLLRIYPTPSSTLTMEASGLKELSVTAWCSYAPTLVRATAEIELYTLVLHDEAAAARAGVYALREKAKLMRRLPTMAGDGQLVGYL